MYAIWAVLAAIFAVGQEILFKRGWDWPGHWWVFIPMAIVISFSIYKLVTNGPTLLVAIVTFSLSTLLLRSLASQFLLGEPLARGNLVALFALGLAVVAGNLWK